MVAMLRPGADGSLFIAGIARLVLGCGLQVRYLTKGGMGDAGPRRTPSLEPIPPCEVSHRLIRTDVFSCAAVGSMLTAVFVFHFPSVEDRPGHVCRGGGARRRPPGRG